MIAVCVLMHSTGRRASCLPATRATMRHESVVYSTTLLQSAPCPHLSELHDLCAQCALHFRTAT